MSGCTHAGLDETFVDEYTTFLRDLVYLTRATDDSRPAAHEKAIASNRDVETAIHAWITKIKVWKWLQCDYLRRYIPNSHWIDPFGPLLNQGSQLTIPGCKLPRFGFVGLTYS